MCPFINNKYIKHVKCITNNKNKIISEVENQDRGEHLLFKRYALVGLLFFSCWSQADLSFFLSKKKSSHKWALVPSYSRSETMGHEVSGRMFIYPTTKKGLYLSVNSKWRSRHTKSFSFANRTIYWFKNGRELSIEAQLDPLFYNPFYHQDSSLQTPSFQKKQDAFSLNEIEAIEVPTETAFLKSFFYFPYRTSSFKGMVLDIRYRKELDQPCYIKTTKKRINNYWSKLKEQNRDFKIDKNRVITSLKCNGYLEKELGVALGLAVKSDTRDNLFNPQSGYLYQSEFKIGYDFFNEGPFFSSIEAKIRHIYSFSKRLKLAMKLGAGWVHYFANQFQSIPYSYQFALGGSRSLRGYHLARFYSNKYYLFQADVIESLTTWLDGSLFMDVGHVSVKEAPKLSVGFGLRIGLPPNYDQRLTLEMAYGYDQKNFVVSFAYPY